MKTNADYNTTANAYNLTPQRQIACNADEMNLLFPLPHIRQQMPKMSVKESNLPSLDLNSSNYLFGDEVENNHIIA